MLTSLLLRRTRTPDSTALTTTRTCARGGGASRWVAAVRMLGQIMADTSGVKERFFYMWCTHSDFHIGGPKPKEGLG